MLVPVAVPQTESQLVVMVSILEGNGIKHYIHNRGFGGLYPGMHMHLFNNQVVMVSESQAFEAFELLSLFRAPLEDFELNHKLRWHDKLRVVFELFVGHWCVPVRTRSPFGDANADT